VRVARRERAPLARHSGCDDDVAMFIGHFAVGFASKRLAPRTSLGALMAAPLLLDLVWPIFLAFGIEHARIAPGITAVTPLDLYDYPYTHSLVGALGWSVAAAALYLCLRPDRRVALVLAAGVFSHWVLDFVTHRPDMAIYPGGSARVGLGLWYSIPATVAIEGAMFIAGVALYAKTTRARDTRGRVSFWAYVGLLAVLYVATFVTPPPATMGPVIVGGLLSWLFVAWAWSFDRHREVA
jgi:membrane-bound metal-dependent hydrolase YbcI (DUF457 family)